MPTLCQRSPHHMTTRPQGAEGLARGTQGGSPSHSHSLRRAQNSSPTSCPHRCWGHLHCERWKLWHLQRHTEVCRWHQFHCWGWLMTVEKTIELLLEPNICFIFTMFLVKAVPCADVISLGFGVTSQNKVTAFTSNKLTTFWTWDLIIWSNTFRTFFVHSTDTSWPLVHQNHPVPILSYLKVEVTNISFRNRWHN